MGSDPSASTRARAAGLLLGSLLVSAACWLDWPGFLRGTTRRGGGWLWRYYERPREPIAFALLFCGFALAAWLLDRHARGNDWRLPGAGACLLVFVVQVASLGWAQSGDGNPWRAMTNHVLRSGSFETLEQFPDLRPVFRDWPRLRAELPKPHVPYQPPFALLPAWLSARLTEAQPSLAHRIAAVSRARRDVESPMLAASALVCALAMLAVCALNPILLTLLLRARHDPHSVAIAAVASIAPGILMHSPSLYQLQAPFFSACALAAQTMALPAGALVAGLVIGCVAELSFLAPALGNWIAVVVLARCRDARTAIVSCGALIGGVLLVLFAAQLATGFSWFGGLFAALAAGHPEEILKRPYTASLWRNAIDVVVWCGPLPFLGALVGGLAAARSLLRGEAPDGFALGGLVGLFVLNLSGATRAEVGRVWIPYFPLLVVAAAPTLRGFFPGRWLAGAAAAQLLHAFVMMSRWGS